MTIVHKMNCISGTFKALIMVMTVFVIDVVELMDLYICNYICVVILVEYIDLDDILIMNSAFCHVYIILMP